MAEHMARDTGMEGYAQDCIRLARLTPDPEIRDALMKLAAQWTAAAIGSKQQDHPGLEPGANQLLRRLSTRRAQPSRRRRKEASP